MSVNKILVIAVFITVQFSTHLSNAETFSIGLSNLNKEKVIVQTSTNYYVMMNKETRKFQITCTKLKAGKFIVLVNDFKPIEKGCNSYIPGSPQDDFFCSSKTFEIDSTNISINSDHYTISCSTEESPEDIKVLKLYKRC